MADISAEIAAFKNSVYGEDVRDALVQLAIAINNESTAAYELKDKPVIGYPIAITSQSERVEPYDDANTLPANTIVNYVYTSVFPDNCPETPENHNMLSILTYSRSNNRNQLYGTVQIAVSAKNSNEGLPKVYFRMLTTQPSTGTWTGWKSLSDSDEIEEAIADAKTKNDILNIALFDNAEKIAISLSMGRYIINGSGGFTDDDSTYAYKYADVSRYDYILYSRLHSTTLGNDVCSLAFYSTNSQQSVISTIPILHDADCYSIELVKVPDNAMYIRGTFAKALNGEIVCGIRKKPLEGLKLSVLSDSMSAYKGYIPNGNDAYYTGSNSDLDDVNSMWWKILCNCTGMEPLVIDAWSGSSIAYNYSTSSGHSDIDKIPMSSDLRTQRLGTNSNDPDIIIISGGTNDWTYSTSTTTPLGSFDDDTIVNRQDVLNGTSTFAASYASTIFELQANYPNAIIVCASLYHTNRGTTSSNGIRKNSMDVSVRDYNKVVKDICEHIGVPYIDIYNIGFTYTNYGNYANDTPPTHANTAGQAIIARRFIETLPELVKPFLATR